jgi:hypothetical protein
MNGLNVPDSPWLRIAIFAPTFRTLQFFQRTELISLFAASSPF